MATLRTISKQLTEAGLKGEFSVTRNPATDKSGKSFPGNEIKLVVLTSKGAVVSVIGETRDIPSWLDKMIVAIQERKFPPGANRGGFRGGGRKPLGKKAGDAPPFSIRLIDSQREEYHALGGVTWLRNYLDRSAKRRAKKMG